MTRYLDDQATIDTMNVHLRDICPTLFSADDAVYAKVGNLTNLCFVWSDENLIKDFSFVFFLSKSIYLGALFLYKESFDSILFSDLAIHVINFIW